MVFKQYGTCCFLIKYCYLLEGTKNFHVYGVLFRFLSKSNHCAPPPFNKAQEKHILSTEYFPDLVKLNLLMVVYF